MNRLKLLTIAVFAGLCSQQTSAQNQRICGTMDHLNQQLAADPGLQKRMNDMEQNVQQWIAANPNHTEAVITIPVVFHVVYANSAQNISDAKCQAQISQLNLDFARANTDAGSTPAAFAGVAANTQIQFCLAQRDPSGNPTTGIVHKSTTTSSFTDNDNVKFSSSGGDNAWDATKYLNIWSCNLGGGLLGYAQFPGGSNATDGVVLLYSSIGSMLSPGTASPYNLGRTATHEVGHWVNLYHIWGDDGTACTGSDLVSDTPGQADETYGCPSFPQVSCSNGPNGDMFMNYMDYTDDACMNMFTAGQASRATASINSSRAGLLTSLGCTPPTGGTCGVPSSLTTSSITTTTASLSWTAGSGAVSYNVQYRVSGGSWVSTTSTTTSKALSGLSSGTAYEWQAQTVCSAASSAWSSSATFTTTSTGGGCNGDPYESNGTSATAKTIAVNTDIYALIGSTTDKDYFKFTTTTSAPKVNVLLSNLPADYDVRLYNSNVSQLGISQNAGTTSESIKYNTATTGKTYYVQVFGYGGAMSNTQCYILRCNTSATNFRIDPSDQSNSGKPLSQVDVYPNPANNKVAVAFNSQLNQTATIKMFDMVGKMVYSINPSVTEGSNVITLDVATLAKGTYMLQVINGNEVYNAKMQIEK